MKTQSAQYEDRLHFRRATKNDVALYLTWANDVDVRGNSFNTEEISLESHTIWFQAKLQSPSSFLFVCCDEEDPVGQIRFEKEENSFLINFSVDKRYRGRGIGKFILRRGTKYLRSLLDGKNMRILGYVKKGNTSSAHAFYGAGFRLFEETKIHGDDTLVFIDASTDVNG